MGRFADRLLALLGLDFDFDLSERPFSRIDDHLDLGRRPVPAEVEALRERGITHVVSCLPRRQRLQMTFLETSFDWLFLPTHDGIDEDIAGAFPALFRFVDDALERPGSRVLVHCEVGVSRSATLVTALRMKTERQRFFEAFTVVRERRAQVLPNIGFASQLQRLEHELLGPRPGELSSLTRYLCERCNAPVAPAVLQSALEQHDHHARHALEALFGGEIPRVVQGVRR